MSVLLGNGDGTFQAQANVRHRKRARTRWRSADFNGDGKPDLVTADQSANTVSVLLGNGDGTFQARQAFATGSPANNVPNSVAIGDFNGDGKAGHRRSNVNRRSHLPAR